MRSSAFFFLIIFGLLPLLGIWIYNIGPDWMQTTSGRLALCFAVITSMLGVANIGLKDESN